MANSQNHKRYSRSTFQKTYSLSSSSNGNGGSAYHNQLYRRCFETASLKLKIIQNRMQQSSITPESPSDEMYKTPNTTLDNTSSPNDSAMEIYGTPLSDFTLVKMKSMTNLLDEKNGGGHLKLIPEKDSSTTNLARMKSLGSLANQERNFGDTPTDLLKMKRDFESTRFNNAKMQSLNNLQKEMFLNVAKDENDDVQRRHHSDNNSDNENYPMLRNSYQASGTFKKKIGIGDTKYLHNDCVDGVEDSNYELTRMRSLGTMSDIVNGNCNKNSRNFDPFWTPNVIRKYDKSNVTPMNLVNRFQEADNDVFYNQENCDKRLVNGQKHQQFQRKSQPPLVDRQNNRHSEKVFKVPEHPSIPLRKEKSSSSIEAMRIRQASSSSLYDRIR